MEDNRNETMETYNGFVEVDSTAETTEDRDSQIGKIVIGGLAVAATYATGFASGWFAKGKSMLKKAGVKGLEAQIEAKKAEIEKLEEKKAKKLEDLEAEAAPEEDSEETQKTKKQK